MNNIIIFSLFIQKPGHNNTRNLDSLIAHCLNAFSRLSSLAVRPDVYARRFFSFSLYLYHWHAAHFEIRGKDQMEKYIVRENKMDENQLVSFNIFYKKEDGCVPPIAYGYFSLQRSLFASCVFSYRKPKCTMEKIIKIYL